MSHEGPTRSHRGAWLWGAAFAAVVVGVGAAAFAAGRVTAPSAPSRAVQTAAATALSSTTATPSSSPPTASPTPSTLQTFAASGVFTVTYPVGWQAVDRGAAGCGDQACVDGGSFAPPGYADLRIGPIGYGVFVSNLTPRDWFIASGVGPITGSAGDTLGVVDASEAPVNGYAAFCARVITNSYVDRTCVLRSNGRIISWSLREVELGYSPSSPSSVNQITVRAQYVPDFLAIVRSIRFP